MNTKQKPMKKIIVSLSAVALLMILPLLFSACNLFDDVVKVELPVKLEQIIEVNDITTGTNKTYTQSVLLDATANKDVNTYKDKIKDFRINKITYVISDFVGTTGTKSSGQIGFSQKDQTAATVFGTITDVDLASSSAAGTSYDLTVDNIGQATIATLLRDDKALKIYMSGSITKTPARFKIKVILDVTVNANPL